MSSKGVVEAVKELTDQHPYYPTNVSLPGFRYARLPFEQILIVFSIAAALVFLLSYAVAGVKRHLNSLDRIIFSWWVLTGLIHMVIEGWVVAVPSFYKDTSGNFLSEVWKEYANADSRYATRDPFVICMEAVTAFMVGPLCVVAVYGQWAQKPWRHVLQIVLSTCQAYGDINYYATSWYEGLIHSRPEFRYFWIYFVAVNFIWILVPFLIGLRCWRQISHAIALVDRDTKTKEHKSS